MAKIDDQELLDKIDSLKVVELKQQLKLRGISVSGLKVELVERLRKELQGGQQKEQRSNEGDDQAEERKEENLEEKFVEAESESARLEVSEQVAEREKNVSAQSDEHTEGNIQEDKVSDEDITVEGRGVDAEMEKRKLEDAVDERERVRRLGWKMLKIGKHQKNWFLCKVLCCLNYFRTLYFT